MRFDQTTGGDQRNVVCGRGQSEKGGAQAVLEVSQKNHEIFSMKILLKYNSHDVEAQVVAVQYQAVIPYLVETVVRRVPALTRVVKRPNERKCNGNWYC